jgi:hypothetical protein
VSLRSWLLLTGTLAAALAASVAFWLRPPAPGDPLELRAAGIGPLTLGRPYEDASRDALAIAPETAFSGSGCGGLDEIRYAARLDDLPVTVMAMARDERLVEIEVSRDTPVQSPDEQSCIALREQLGVPFTVRFGPFQAEWLVTKPVSREHFARAGPVVLVARWFPTGGSCYVSAHYGYGSAFPQSLPGG